MGEYFWGQSLRAPQVSKSHQGHELEKKKEEEAHICSVYIFCWSISYLLTTDMGDTFLQTGVIP